jgi:competence protein ComEA
LLHLWLLWTLFQLIVAVGGGLERASTGPARPLVPRRLDPNRARAPELALLPGIGPRRAAAIVLRRVREGPFRALDELAEVPGIGRKTLAAVRPGLELGAGRAAIPEEPR